MDTVPAQSPGFSAVLRYTASFKPAWDMKSLVLKNSDSGSLAPESSNEHAELNFSLYLIFQMEKLDPTKRSGWQDCWALELELEASILCEVGFLWL